MNKKSLLAAVLLSISAMVGPSVAFAERTLVVNTTSDVLAPGVGFCSLRGAIDSANQGVDDNGCEIAGVGNPINIIFGSFAGGAYPDNGSVNLLSVLPLIGSATEKNIVIDGVAKNPVINGQGMGGFLMATADEADLDVTVKNLSIRNGVGPGFSSLSDEAQTWRFQNLKFQALGTAGVVAALEVGQLLKTVLIDDTTFGGLAPADHNGHDFSVFNSSSVTMTGGSVLGNSSSINGSIIIGGSELNTMTNVTLVDAAVRVESGAGKLVLDGVQSSGVRQDVNNLPHLHQVNGGMELDVLRSRFTGAPGSPNHHAIRISGSAPVLIQDTLITGYQTTDEAPAISIDSPNGNLVVIIDRVTIHDNTATNDTAGLGCFPSAATTVVVNNSTLFGNEAVGGAGGAVVAGTNCSINIKHSTITGNRSAGTGAGIEADDGSIIVDHTVLADNINTAIPEASDCATVGGGLVSSNGFNFISQDDGCAATFPNPHPTDKNANDDFVEANGGDPELAAPGGLLPVRMPLAGSFIVDEGDTTCGVAVDQLQNGRPVGGFCDMGAIEQGGTAVDVVTIIPDPAPQQNINANPNGTVSMISFTIANTSPNSVLIDQIGYANLGVGSLANVAGVTVKVNNVVDGNSPAAADGNFELGAPVVLNVGEQIVVEVLFTFANVIAQNEGDTMQAEILFAGAAILPMIGLMGLVGMGGRTRRRPLMAILVVITAISLTGCVELLLGSSSDDDDDGGDVAPKSRTYQLEITNVGTGLGHVGEDDSKTTVTIKTTQ